MRKTKILVTLGPAAESEPILAQLLDAGMNVARLNFSHGDYEEHGRRIERIKSLRVRSGKPVALMLDTKGPEIRSGDLETGACLLTKGSLVTVTTNDMPGTPHRFTIRFPSLPLVARPGSSILLDDGLIQLEVREVVNDTDVLCTVVHGGSLRNRRNVHVPRLHLDLPNPTPKDCDDLIFAARQGFDFIAVSFTESAATIAEVRRILAENGAPNIKIIAKIENHAGLDRFDEILAAADGIMVARGDLGVELAAEEVPIVQKEIIRKCYMAGKPVITATQMLHSMMENPRPTRAEVSDVANAIYDQTSAVMLSGETSVGRFPVECVELMARTAERAEQAIDYQRLYFGNPSHREGLGDTTFAMTNAAVTTAYNIGAKAIVTVTETGQTAQMLSRLRPSIPIIAIAENPQVFHQMSINWGVVPVAGHPFRNLDELHAETVRLARETGLLQEGDLVVLVAGVPVGHSGATNMIKIERIGAYPDSIRPRRSDGSGRDFTVITGGAGAPASIPAQAATAVADNRVTSGSTGRQPIPLRREPRSTVPGNLCSCSSILFDDCMESF